MLNKIQWYGISGAIKLILQYILTKITHPEARLIRYPIRIRSNAKVKFNSGFTCGVDLRLDIFGSGIFRVGKNVQLNDYVHIGVYERVEVGDNCLIASRVFITDHDHGCYSGAHPHDSPSSRPMDRGLASSPVTICSNVWIGEGAIILKGVTIGEGSIIAAGALVNRDLPEGVIAAGVPAKVISRYNMSMKRWERTE